MPCEELGTLGERVRHRKGNRKGHRLKQQGTHFHALKKDTKTKKNERNNQILLRLLRFRSSVGSLIFGPGGSENPSILTADRRDVTRGAEERSRHRMKLVSFARLFLRRMKNWEELE